MSSLGHSEKKTRSFLFKVCRGTPEIKNPKRIPGAWGSWEETGLEAQVC
jgi:hypothetical protein